MVTTDQQVLFSLPPRRKQASPAYLPSRQEMTRRRDTAAAAFREHATACGECAAAPARAALARTGVHVTACTHGAILIWPAVQASRGLRRGIYPDRPAAQPPQPAAMPATQETLF